MANETTNGRKKKNYHQNSLKVRNNYNLAKFIYGYLIIKYNPEDKSYFRVKDDILKPYYTSSLINHRQTEDGLFDITIKDGSEDQQGTPPYIILNL